VSSLTCATANLAHAAPPDPDGDAPALDGDTLEHDEAPAEDEPPQTAGEWYARGYELGNAGDYAAAADAFLRSYVLQPTSEALFNAALGYENAGATLDAIATYERFLDEPARKEDLVDAARRSIDAMLEEVAVLKGVRFAATRPPAQLLVQGQPVELDRFPLLVLPGAIEIEVIDEHGIHARETYELAPGETLFVDLRALLPPPREPDPDPDPVISSGPSADQLEAGRAHARLALSLRTTTWIGLGLSGAGAVSVVSLGLLAQREQRRFNTDSCYTFPNGVCPPDFDIGDPNKHQRAYTRYALSAAVMGGITGGLAITTLVIGLVSVRHARRARQLTDNPTVRVLPGLGGVTLEF
jgi:tetratricopeptide (TPR) repeat protein